MTNTNLFREADAKNHLNQLSIMFKTFARNERGAVTIDWVILTAGIVVMTIGAMAVFRIDETGIGFHVGMNQGVANPIPEVTGGNWLSRLVYTIKYSVELFRP